MSLSVYGSSTSVVRVAHISTNGVWLLAYDKEFFMSYDDFPWFKDQTVKSIINVEEQSHGHFFWPDIDVDLTEEIIEHSGRFPLIDSQLLKKIYN